MPDLEKAASGASGASGHFVGNHAIAKLSPKPSPSWAGIALIPSSTPTHPKSVRSKLELTT